MIDLLDEAARCSPGKPQFPDYGDDEFTILRDLIDSNKVRGSAEHLVGAPGIRLDGITLEGRQFRDELIARRDAKSYTARIKNVGWIVMGWLGGLMTIGAKALIEHFLNRPSK